jgi:glyoxylase-like metal-dependent hydrolase (beta-lactamase superfamily II)
MNEKKQGPYAAREISGNLWSIDQDFVRSFLVIGSREALLVDTCDADEDLKGFVETLTAKPLRVVQTHGDRDHIGASARFDRVYMHPAEFNFLRSTSDLPIRLAALREGEALDLGGRSLEVILIPGHTPGSIALLDRENRLLFSGDSVKADTVYAFGPGRSLEAYIDSLKRLEGLRSSFDTILPSHGRLPVEPEILTDLIEGAEKLFRGELKREDAGGMPCGLYRWKRASFFYSY